MVNTTDMMTKYFRSAVAAQANIGIDFKIDDFYQTNMESLIEGEIDSPICATIFQDINKKEEANGKKVPNEKSHLNIILCAKTIKTIFEANEKAKDEIEELTGIYFIPAILNHDGKLSCNVSDKKLPWFPREYLEPMIEPKLAIGKAESVDSFMSNHVAEISKINSWKSYIVFTKKLYEFVAESAFENNEVRSLDTQESNLELDKNVYIFIDKSINSTYHIMKLYNHISNNHSEKKLYEKFMLTKLEETVPLINDDIEAMKLHVGQMGGEYPLSCSQREAINHFNIMEEGEILAINGPPGTGKTTLLQSIVADMFVKRAINKDKPPIIVATSTNNQAVTNIIDSFGKIDNTGMFNLENRWITNVDSFATYFPSVSQAKKGINNNYQFTNQKGEYFVENVDNEGNLTNSKVNLIKECSEYFDSDFNDVYACQNRLHEELVTLDNCKKSLLYIVQEADRFQLNGQPIDKYIIQLEEKTEALRAEISSYRQRVDEWKKCYYKIPFIYRILKFIRMFSKKIELEFRLHINEQEQDYITENMDFEQILERYSQLITAKLKKLSLTKEKRDRLISVKDKYDREIETLNRHKVIVHANDVNKYKLDLNTINHLLDTSIRYTEFWLAVHYFECRWVNGEYALTEKQKGKNYENVLQQFYTRLSMITPCLVMTFFVLPSQFQAYGDQKSFYMYNFIDLLIVDEAGQVSPEIAACSFSLAKKAVVVGDINQIEPVWSVNRALDKALAISNRVIQKESEFELLDVTGLNSSSSSVMQVAASSCKYEKYGEKGLFLSEHRRCYDEIIAYCNQLVYKGRLEPKRGSGRQDEKAAIKALPQMGFRQIDSKQSSKKGSSRYNREEAKEIAIWLMENFEALKTAYNENDLKNLVGIITPFKAQVHCLQAEVKNHLAKHAKHIEIGTVHTFQGGEKKIIIMSTVYGELDGCFFIDNNKSLMNVAVSRAKDHFWIFGDTECLKDNKSSASGLLKYYIKGNELKD
ncbi:AAA domain-containing protein [Desulfuribacillus alkaliarsenatis]|uniref:DNA helicase n=1 Tax=Desulfuribacillus alkaliarsenatis TaxID=766136 RepID=A0A1E5G0X1_9FIRM|nr:AAA domain-containing protein [Desulfuribacillus alkaliarsenatis]OEF96562.1 DNA helicase [Desulfuribacillus alkaliarsenatis]